jgi:hypothetical protein
VSRLPENLAMGLAVPKDNATYASILSIINESLKGETALAIGPAATPEQRAWQCGRADALNTLKELIVNVREDALRQRDMPIDS